MGSSVDEQILRSAKEIIVKYIETGRVSPAAFPETFKTIYTAIQETVKGQPAGEVSEEDLPEPEKES